MLLSDISIKRPVFATVLALLLITFGVISFLRLPLREFPDIDPPVISIETNYRGAAANVVETRITEVIEQRIAGVEGIDFIESTSENGRSRITVTFRAGRDIDAATNDVRDRVSTVLDDLPDQADPPEVGKVDSNDDVVLWLNLESDKLTVPELTDYARRYLVDRFSVLNGVARVQLGGGQTWAMRIWLDRRALAARDITVTDVEQALVSENIELPAGTIESSERAFTIRTERAFQTPDDFRQIVLKRGADGYLVRLGEVARVEREPEESRTFFRGNTVPMVGLGIIKQSTANTIDVARAVKAEARRLAPTLPEGMRIRNSYDTSVFIEGAIREVYFTLALAIGLVILVIYLFLGSGRATLVPAVTVPVSLIATFLALHLMGFTVNILTLLALVLAIGIVVDDAIIVLENIVRRMQELGETTLVAAYRGTREVGFAVVATTLVLIAVFVPIAFLGGDFGRLFSEFALTISAAVAFSSLMALSLSPMVASKILRRKNEENRITAWMNRAFTASQAFYLRLLRTVLARKITTISVFLLLCGGCWWLLNNIPSEYTPREDRGAFFVLVNGPEGATHGYIKEYMDEIEKRLVPYTESGEALRLLVRTPRNIGSQGDFNTGIIVFVLADWAERRSAWVIMDEVRKKLADLPGVTAFPVMRQGLGARVQKPVQFVLGGDSYEELAAWRDILLEKIRANNPGLEGIDWDYKETKPQIQVKVDYDRAAELGVTVANIGRTLETMLGSRRITTYIENGEEYDVLLEGDREKQRTPANLENIYVRSARSGELIPLSNLVTLEEFADSNTLNRYNRTRALTIEANLAEGYTLGEALEYLRGLARENLPDTAQIDYKGQSRNFQESGKALLFVFALGLVIVFLVLAAQFESFVHPLVIMLTVPLAIAGGLLGLYLSGNTLNLFSQIGLIILVGIAAKNGILIVEFANQLRDQGMAFDDALLEASRVRLRPILMTGITTAASAIPLIFAFGAGAETRAAIGIVMLSGVLVATFFTLFLVPAGYSLLARGTGSPGDVARRLERESSVQAQP
jgi:multidrug efflux pump